MYHLDNTSGVPEMPEPKDTQTISTRWFGESQEQGGISWPGADWFNIVQSELLAVLSKAGIEPDKKAHDQLSKSIDTISKSFEDNIAPAYLKTTSDILNLEPINVLRNINPKYWNAIRNGTFDEDLSTNINELIDAISGVGRPGALIMTNGLYPLGNSMIVKRFCKISGAGSGHTTIKALPGSNIDVIISENFHELTGSGLTTSDSSLVPSWMSVQGVCINGNRYVPDYTNPLRAADDRPTAAGAPFVPNGDGNIIGNGLSLYGPRIFLDDIIVMRAAAHGLYTEYSDKIGSNDYIGQEEGALGKVISRENGDMGWLYRGPHNSLADQIICCYNKNWGFRTESVSNQYDGNLTQLHHLHCYANANATNNNGNGLNKEISINSVVSADYIVIDGGYGEFCGKENQISMLKCIFGGETENGINITGNNNNIGMINAQMKSGTSGKLLLNVEGSGNYIGRALLLAPESDPGHDGLRVAGDSNVISCMIRNARNALTLSGGFNHIDMHALAPRNATMEYLTPSSPTGSYNHGNVVRISANQSLGDGYFLGDRPVDLYDDFSVLCMGSKGIKLTKSSFQSGLFALDTVLAQRISIPHMLAFTPSAKNVSCTFFSSSQVGTPFDLHFEGADATNAYFYIKFYSAPPAGSQGRITGRAYI